MNEKQWMESTDWRAILQVLDGSNRKLRLFGCALCRRVWQFMEDERSRIAVNTSERYADALVTKQILSASQGNANLVLQRRANRRRIYAEGSQSWLARQRIQEAAMAAKGVARPTDRTLSLLQQITEVRTRVFNAEAIGNVVGVIAQILISHKLLLCDVSGNPFRPVTIDPRWLTSTVVDLANNIYTERAFDRMALLADALMDAGCDNEEIINHCRSEGPHARGCWVVDLLTGRN